MYDLFAIILCYTLGSLPFSVWLCQLSGLQDPRTYGSKNPGSTNVSRQNKMVSVGVLICDISKAYIPLWALSHNIHGESLLIPLCASAIMLGHCYSLFLRGHGGKGVACALGALSALSGPLTLAILSVWLLALLASKRRVYIASISAASTGILWSIITLIWPTLWPHSYALSLTLFAVSTVILWRHRHDFNRAHQHTGTSSS